MALFTAPRPKKDDPFERFATSSKCLHVSVRHETEYGGPYDLNEFDVEYCNDCGQEVKRTFWGRR